MFFATPCVVDTDQIELFKLPDLGHMVNAPTGPIPDCVVVQVAADDGGFGQKILVFCQCAAKWPKLVLARVPAARVLGPGREQVEPPPPADMHRKYVAQRGMKRRVAFQLELVEGKDPQTLVGIITGPDHLRICKLVSAAPRKNIWRGAF